MFGVLHFLKGDLSAQRTLIYHSFLAFENSILPVAHYMFLVNSKLHDFSIQVKFYECDVSSRDGCFQTVASVISDFGKINHLVNAVAYFGSKGLNVI